MKEKNHSSPTLFTLKRETASLQCDHICHTFQKLAFAFLDFPSSTTEFSPQTYLEQICGILDMRELLHSDTTRLWHLCVGSAVAGSDRGPCLCWHTAGGTALVKAAGQADVRLMLQLLICSQASLQIHAAFGFVFDWYP